MKKLLITALLMPLVSFSQIENGMVAHFPFNNDLTDHSTSLSTMTNHGATFGSDRNSVANDAIDFNGNSYVSVSGNAMKTQFPITVSYWIKLNSLSNVNTFFKTDAVYDNSYGIWMNNLPTGGISLSFAAGLGGTASTNQRYFTTTNTITANTWHHIVGIIRSYNDMDIYIDCVRSPGTYGGSGSTAIGYSSNGETRIGGTTGGVNHPDDYYLDGSIDQFAMWNRSLSVSEINFLCDLNNTLAVEEISLSSKPKELVKIVDLLGREIIDTTTLPTQPLLFIFSDGTVEKKVSFEK